MPVKTAISTIIMTSLLALVSIGNLALADSHCEFADETILLGGIVPLSAPGAVAGGKSMEWGFQQAAADINAACGIEIAGVSHRLEIIIGDSKGFPQDGMAAAERLVSQDKVHGVVGVFHSAVGLAIMDMLQEHKIPTVLSHLRHDNITASGFVEINGRPPRIDDGVDYIFRISPPSSFVGKTVTNWLISLGVQDVVYVAENTAYGRQSTAAESVDLVANGIAVQTLEIEQGAEDFSHVVSQLQARSAAPDAVRLLVSGSTAHRLAQQLAELGLVANEDTICMTNQTAFQSEAFWDIAPKGNFCVFDHVGPAPSQFNELAAELDARFGDVLPSASLQAYDSVSLLADAMARADSYTDPDAIVAALESTDIDLSQGHYYFTYGSHNPDLPEGTPAYMWHQWPVPVVTVMQYFESGQSALDAAVVYPEVFQTHGTAYTVPGTTP